MIITTLSLIGLCFGSFINALTWRLHQRQELIESSSKALSKKQQARLEQLSITTGRSMCPECEHQLAWYDLLPVVSWLVLGGRCRYCHRPISVQYPLVELLTAGVFGLSYLWWPYPLDGALEIGLLVLWLVMSVLLVALLVFDLKWYLLPNKLTYPLIGSALIYGLLRTIGVEDLSLVTALIQLVLGALAVGGLYYILYAASDGAWVGGGDYKLGIAMGLILGWQAGLLAVFMANVLGLVVILPGLIMKNISMKSRIPFGPFLITSLFIGLLFGQSIIQWYIEVILAI